MLKISDFSRISRVSIRALRLYDELGLLPPAYVDPGSGYRYYSVGQLPRLNRILALKELGFSLEQIAPMLAEGVSPEQLRGMLALKRAEAEQRVAAEQERLARITARLQQIEREGQLGTYEVVLKHVPAQRAILARAAEPAAEDVSGLSRQVGELLQRHGLHDAGPWLHIHYDAEWRGEGADIGAAVLLAAPLGQSAAAPGAAALTLLPEVTQMAAVVHRGRSEALGDAYNALGAWIEANGYTIVGPCREIFLRWSSDGESVIEVQFPVGRDLSIEN